MAVYPGCLCCVVLCGYRSCDEPIAWLCIRVVYVVLFYLGTGPAMNRSHGCVSGLSVVLSCVGTGPVMNRSHGCVSGLSMLCCSVWVQVLR
jgi:hypothetical protein